MFISLVGTTLRYTCSGRHQGVRADELGETRQESTGSMSMKFMAQTHRKMVMANARSRFS